MARAKRKADAEAPENRKKQRNAGDTKDKLVEAVNSLSSQDFFAKFCPDNSIAELTKLLNKYKLQAIQKDASEIGALRELCLCLIDETSAEDYRKSGKWSIDKKRKEMSLPDMKYIVLLEKNVYRSEDVNDPRHQLAGFISFMVTYEDGKEVLYLYEIHFCPIWQGSGMGKKLMDVVEQIAQSVGVEKVMLTVFKTNIRAVEWYHHLGYTMDEFSPAPRTFKNGRVKEATYSILSKAINPSDEQPSTNDETPSNSEQS